MTVFSWEDFLPLLAAFLAVGGIVLMGVKPSVAQTSQPQEDPLGQSPDQRIENPGKQRSSSGLPSWAKPSTPPINRGGTTLGEKNATTAAPTPPSEPTQVPVDGGLALLAVAGAGYAVRKLQGEDDEKA